MEKQRKYQILSTKTAISVARRNNWRPSARDSSSLNQPSLHPLPSPHVPFALIIRQQPASPTPVAQKSDKLSISFRV